MKSSSNSAVYATIMPPDHCMILKIMACLPVQVFLGQFLNEGFGVCFEAFHKFGGGLAVGIVFISPQDHFDE